MKGINLVVPEFRRFTLMVEPYGYDISDTRKLVSMAYEFCERSKNVDVAIILPVSINVNAVMAYNSYELINLIVNDIPQINRDDCLVNLGLRLHFNKDDNSVSDDQYISVVNEYFRLLLLDVDAYKFCGKTLAIASDIPVIVNVPTVYKTFINDNIPMFTCIDGSIDILDIYHTAKDHDVWGINISSYGKLFHKSINEEFVMSLIRIFRLTNPSAFYIKFHGMSESITLTDGQLLFPLNSFDSIIDYLDRYTIL